VSFFTKKPKNKFGFYEIMSTSDTIAPQNLIDLLLGHRKHTRNVH